MSEVLAADGSENFAVHSATGVVYVAGNDGVLRGFDPVTHQLVSAWQIGTDLQAIAISKDGTYALVTEAVPVSHSDSNDWTSNETVSAVYKVDLASGGAETLTYASTGSDYTLGDVAFTDDNTAVFSQNILPGWSGWAPLVVLDIASGAFTPTGSYYAGPSASSLTQSASADQILLGQLNLSSAEYYLIDDSGNAADGNGTYENGVYGYAAGIEAFTGSGNEGRIALVSGGGLHVYDGEFDYIADLAQTHAFLGSSPGITFSAVGSTLYAIDATADRIVALSVADWSITGSFAIGNYDYSVLAYGEELALAPDGSQFYVSTTQGVVVVPLMVETRGTAGDDMMVGTLVNDWFSGLGATTRSTATAATTSSMAASATTTWPVAPGRTSSTAAPATTITRWRTRSTRSSSMPGTASTRSIPSLPAMPSARTSRTSCSTPAPATGPATNSTIS
jgi:hypothetical protein